MAFSAIAFDREGGLAVMAGTTGFALGHVGHGQAFTAAIGKELGVTVLALEGCRMEVMAEIADHGPTAVFEGQVGRLVALMTLVAVSAGSKGGLAVMAGTTGLAFFHLCHGGLA